jgi:hypothetical protein
MKTLQHPRRLGGALLLVVATGAFLVGCGPATPASSSSSTAAATACADAAELKSSVQTLAEVKPLQDGLNALEDAAADTKAALDTSVASATAALQPAVDQVKSEFAAVQTAMDGLSADNLSEKGPAIGTALRGLRTALSSLGTTLSQECPAS